VALLAARSPKLRPALRDAAKAGHAYLVIDGTLIPIDRVAADRPFYSGKHRNHGMNLKVIASRTATLCGCPGLVPCCPGPVATEFLHGTGIDPRPPAHHPDGPRRRRHRLPDRAGPRRDGVHPRAGRPQEPRHEHRQSAHFAGRPAVSHRTANEARPTPPTPHRATMANFALFDLVVLQLSPRIQGPGLLT